MDTMSRAAQPRGTGRSRRQAGAVLRVCAALWLVFYIVYTPIHLYREPHSESADISPGPTTGSMTDVVAADGHDGDDHHGRHPAAQHKFKVTQPTRAPIAEMAPVPAVQWVEAETACPQPRVFGFSGLSPPALSRCWQFFLRAALPVRAPSLLS